MTCWLLPLLSPVALAATQPTPDLAHTAFAATVHGCHALDLTTWRHNAKNVLLDAHAAIAKVELCNDDKLPVFTVALPYDPEGQTDAFYDRLYANLAYANGFWSFALVDTADNIVITASIDRRDHRTTLSYEHFADAPKATP